MLHPCYLQVFFTVFIIYFCSFLPACRTGWVFLPPSLCLSGSSCANFSLWLSLILQLLLSLHLSPSLCMSLSGSFILLLPCYTALSAVTASQDLILTLPPSVLPSSLSFSIPTLFLHSWVLAFDFLSSCISHRIQSSACLSASLQRSS